MEFLVIPQNEAKKEYLSTLQLIHVFFIYTRGGQNFTLKTPKYSFVKTNMKCGFINVIRF